MNPRALSDADRGDLIPEIPGIDWPGIEARCRRRERLAMRAQLGLIAALSLLSLACGLAGGFGQ